MFQLDRITFDEKIMNGQACIRGMRVPVSLILNLIANGHSYESILKDYPYIEMEDILQSIQYAAFLSSEHTYSFNTSKAV
jgi:uncharacterized protein (DUF433 family)